MCLKKKLALGLIALLFVVAAAVYPAMPETMPSHWNAAGEVNGWQPKSVALFLLPAITLVAYLVFVAIPRISVFKENLASFTDEFEGFIMVFTGFMALIYVAMILPNYGYEFNMSQVVMAGLAALFYYLGVIMPRIKRNYFIGIRSPWAIASDYVWEETHKVGGKAFKLLGIAALVSVAFGPIGLWAFIAATLIAVAYLFVFSYLKWKENPVVPK